MIQESQEKQREMDVQEKSLGPEPAESGLVYERKQAQHGNPEPLEIGLKHTQIRISKVKQIRGGEDQEKNHEINEQDILSELALYYPKIGCMNLP